MKTCLASFALALALISSARAADVSVKLDHVHLCCQSCVEGAQKAVAGIDGLTVTPDRNAKTVGLAAHDKATVQRGVDALVTAGYFGASSDPSVKIAASTGAKGQKVKTLKLESVHLCCNRCVTAVDEAIKSVTGVKEQDAKRNAKTFTVTGDFNDKEVFDALHKIGLTGKVAKE